LYVFVPVLAVYKILRQTLEPGASGGEVFMDYIIAGVTSLGLFIYLIYALLHPEKF
jgi:K+-transporting ATPase KdpF subunit